MLWLNLIEIAPIPINNAAFIIEWLAIWIKDAIIPDAVPRVSPIVIYPICDNEEKARSFLISFSKIALMVPKNIATMDAGNKTHWRIITVNSSALNNSVNKILAKT